MTRTFVAACALILCAVSPGAAAVDSASLELGSGDEVNMGRVGVQWKWQKRWWQSGGWHLGGYWDAQLGYWKSHDDSAARNNGVGDISLTPVFRYQRDDGRGLYFEGAIGFHLVTQKEINSNRRFSTSFQFGDHLGAGVRFGARNAWDLGLRVQHISNGSIKRPNPGINFLQARLQYHF